MVCADCEKKLTKIVGVDPFRNKKQNRPLEGVKKVEPTKNRLFGSEKK